MDAIVESIVHLVFQSPLANPFKILTLVGSVENRPRLLYPLIPVIYYRRDIWRAHQRFANRVDAVRDVVDRHSGKRLLRVRVGRDARVRYASTRIHVRIVIRMESFANDILSY